MDKKEEKEVWPWKDKIDDYTMILVPQHEGRVIK